MIDSGVVVASTTPAVINAVNWPWSVDLHECGAYWTHTSRQPDLGGA
jgi:hypothetical protein